MSLVDFFLFSLLLFWVLLINYWKTKVTLSFKAKYLKIKSFPKQTECFEFLLFLSLLFSILFISKMDVRKYVYYHSSQQFYTKLFMAKNIMPEAELIKTLPPGDTELSLIYNYNLIFYTPNIQINMIHYLRNYCSIDCVLFRVL